MVAVNSWYINSVPQTKEKGKKSSEGHKECALKHNTTSTETITWSPVYFNMRYCSTMWRLLDRVKHLQREILLS